MTLAKLTRLAAQWSLATIVAVILLLQITGITLALLYSQYRNESRLLHSYLFEKHRALLTGVGERCSIPLATYDVQDIQHVLSDEIAKAPEHYIGFGIYDAIGDLQAGAPSNKTIAEVVKTAGKTPEKFSFGQYRQGELALIEKPLIIKRWNSAGVQTLIPLGKIVGVFSFKPDQEIMRRRFIGSLLGALALAAIGFIAAFWLLRQLLVTPLRDIISIMRTFSLHNSKFSLAEPTAVREIVDIWAAFKKMTAALTQSQGQLVQAEKMVAVGQLAAGVAHEINNPLGIILGFAQSMSQEGPLSESLSLSVRSIEREAVRCKNLVQEMLTFSRQGAFKMEEFDLDASIVGVLDIVESRARVSAVELVKELGNPKPITGDKNQLQQVVVNLCNNALDAMPGGGKIVIRTRNAGTDSDRVVIEVEDTGEGIPPEIIGQIFNPFFTTKEVGKGTGLGLSLVYEIVQSHHGKVEVASEVGRGSTFTVLLPTKR